jgi:hypothetical protein
MKFNEKINLLIKMTNTTNASLATALEIDPSLISRWRTGVRQPNLSSTYIEKISDYFASTAKEDYQKVALLEVTGYNMVDKDSDEQSIARYLNNWLSGESKINADSIQILLDWLGKESLTPYKILKEAPNIVTPVGKHFGEELFTGKDGLRKSVVKLLLYAIENKKFGNLYLYSDEKIDWIIENQGYANLWGSLINFCLNKGMKIKIIHSIDREPQEIVSAIKRWLPLYMSGSVTSFYYPHKRDSLFNNTNVILEGECVINSVSAKTQNQDTVNYFFIRDKKVINSHLLMFKEQLKLCRTLVKTDIGKKSLNLIDNIDYLFNGKEIYTFHLQTLLTFTMPDNLLRTILERYEVDKQKIELLVEQQKNRLTKIHQKLKTCKIESVISLPRLSEIMKGEFVALLPQLLVEEEINYRAEELVIHLKEIIRIVKNNNNIELFIVPSKYSKSRSPLISIDHHHMIAFKYERPQLLFTSEQRDLTIAVSNFIKQHINFLPKRQTSKTYATHRLRELIKKVEIESSTTL